MTETITITVPKPAIDELVSVPELAREWQCDTQMIRRMINRGEIEAVRVGTRMVRVKRSSLARVLTPITTLDD